MPYVEMGKQLVAEIHVRDIERSKAFCLDLGFRLIREDAGFAVLAWEDHELLREERKDQPLAPAFPQANLRIVVPNVDDYRAHLASTDVKVVAEIGDREYGLRDFETSRSRIRTASASGSPSRSQAGKSSRFGS